MVKVVKSLALAAVVGAFLGAQPVSAAMTKPAYDMIRPVKTAYDMIRPVKTAYDMIRPVKVAYDMIRPVKVA